MIFINSSFKLLPLDKLKAIGIESARADAPTHELTPKRLREWRKHYGPNSILCLPAYHQDDKTMLKIARRAWKEGIRHFQPENEPEGVLMGQTPRTAKVVADRSKMLRDALPGATLYGPTTGIFLPEFIEAFLEAGGEADFIAWNGYAKKIEDIPNDYLTCMIRWGKPGIVTEIAFNPLPEWGNDYPVRCGQVEGFKRMKEACGHLPWTLYPGPQGSGPQKNDALFVWDGTWETTTSTYDQIRTQVTLGSISG